MIKEKMKWSAAVLAGIFLFPLMARPDFVLKIRFFEGTKDGAFERLQVVTSSYSWNAAMAGLSSEVVLEQEIGQIKKIFNLSAVKLVTEAGLNWDARAAAWKTERAFYIFHLDGKEYVIRAVPLDFRKRRFWIEVDEQSDAGKKNLLKTEAVLSVMKAAIFGFEDGPSKSYFLSLRPEDEVQVGVAGGVTGGVAGGVKGGIKGGVEGGVKAGVAQGVAGGIVSAEALEKFEKGAIKAEGDIKPPRLIKRVDPVYPQEALKERVQGIVILGARTDSAGRVEDVIVQRSAPLLDQAAVDAVKQWIYEPMVIDGKPVKVVFTVQLNFMMIDERNDETGLTPKLISRVEPVYPKEARMARMEGVVILEARVDETGKVTSAKALRSIPKLDQAAIDAVKQWKYEPVVVDGKPIPVVITVTVRFVLK